MNLSKTKLTNPVAPEKGSFPLDHFDECHNSMEKFVPFLFLELIY